MEIRHLAQAYKRQCPLSLRHTQERVHNRRVKAFCPSLNPVKGLLSAVGAAGLATQPTFGLGPFPANSARVRLRSRLSA